MNRRALVAGATFTLLAPLVRGLRSASYALPVEVAGIRLPRSPFALSAADFARTNCPEFLFNHCMRTFVFGALLLQHRHIEFQADAAFAASALHDLGLLQSFESHTGSFGWTKDTVEHDIANAAFAE